MIIKKTVDGVDYEVVIRNQLTVNEGGEARQWALIVHDPDSAGGRREGFLCQADKVPVNHVVIGTLAFK